MNPIRNPADSHAVAGISPDTVATGDENSVSRVRLFIWGKFFARRLATRVRQVQQFLHEGR
jgi:hypothetical protein